MSRIYGKYILSIDLDDYFAPYQLTNNDRNAVINGSDDVELMTQLKFIQHGMTPHIAVRFITENKLKIKRVRLVTPGCEGLRSSPANPAAVLFLQGRDGVNYGSNIYLKIQKFNEWEDVESDYIPYNLMKEQLYDFYICVNSTLHVDDYNIDTPYVGETVHAILEMEIDTAGLYNGFEVV